MEQQLSLRLSDTLVKQLDQTARRLKRNRSDVVRLALEEFLAVQIETRPIERVRDLIGRVESGIPDLGQHHRAHLKKRIRNAR
jgi:metal-responsive CopG/Arc/MetJ family transcriptional regulator